MSKSNGNKVLIDGLTRYGGLNQPNLKFVKVNVDCWERIFDFLSLRDILAIGQTCQRMRQISGHYFRENFHGTDCFVQTTYAIFYVFHNTGQGIKLERDDFLQFIDTMRICHRFEHLSHWMHEDLFQSLTTLRLCGVELNENEFHGYEKVLNKIVTLELSQCGVFSGFIGRFLDLCTQLECLSFEKLHFDSADAKSSVFQRTFPLLENFQCTKCENTTPNLISFVERNPSIKSLRIGVNDLHEVPQNIPKFRLDCLKIEIGSTLISAEGIMNRLKTLHANGCYKRLHVLLLWTSQSAEETLFNKMASFDGLEVLFTGYCHANIRYLTKLKELHFSDVMAEMDLEEVALSLSKLERLWISGSVDELKPFLRHSKALKTVILDTNIIAPGKPLNLFDLNRERQKSGMTLKVQIGLNENEYLATKWKSNNVNYDFVEPTRTETITKHFDYKDIYCKFQ